VLAKLTMRALRVCEQCSHGLASQSTHEIEFAPRIKLDQVAIHLLRENRKKFANGFLGSWPGARVLKRSC